MFINTNSLNLVSILPNSVQIDTIRLYAYIHMCLPKECLSRATVDYAFIRIFAGIDNVKYFLGT